MSIFSLLPPADARPACISTVMESAMLNSFGIGVSHLFWNSFTMAMALENFPDFSIWRLTTTTAPAAATAAATAQTITAAFFPIDENSRTARLLSGKISRSILPQNANFEYLQAGQSKDLIIWSWGKMYINMKNKNRKIL